ncbi:MAG: hypothetical protein AAF990_03685 [Bacteroidota bacterium]
MVRPTIVLILFFCCTMVACSIFKETAPELEVPPPITFVEEGSAEFQYWVHQPLHPSNNVPVRFKLAAFDRVGLRGASLSVYEYELYRNDKGLPSKRRRAGGQWGLLRDWSFNDLPDSIQLEHLYTEGFPPFTNVEYVFELTDSKDRVSTRLVSFDAGSSPWPNDKILLYRTQNNSLDQSVNICFLPDTDYQNNWKLFLSDTESLIFEGYHQNNMIEGHKDKWGFYYTQQSVDGFALAQDFTNPDRYPPFMKDSLIYGIDAFALLHQSEYSDGAYLYGNIHFLTQNLFTSESYNWGTAVHESAHAVFNLSDEYDGCACFAPVIGGSNVFRSLQACQVFNRDKGYPEQDCRAIQNYEGVDWYIAEPNAFFDTKAECVAFSLKQGLPASNCGLFRDLDGRLFHWARDAVCIMQDDGDRRVPSFQRTCSHVIQSYYDALEGERDWIAGMERHDNMFAYEPVVLAELEVDQESWGVKLERMAYGLPTKNVKKPTDMTIELTDAKGNTIYEFYSDRPDCTHIHGSTDRDRRTLSGKGTSYIALPYKKNYSGLDCRMQQGGEAKKYHWEVRKKVKRLVKRFGNQ